MAIDRTALSREFQALQELAGKKLAQDPAPRGPEANQQMLRDIEKHGLHKEVAELETQGYTVLEPGRAAPIEFCERLRDAIIECQERRGSDQAPGDGFGEILYHLVPEARVFEEVIQQPVPLTLATYLVGYRCKLSQSTAIIKTQHAGPLVMHADHSAKLPTPWPRVARYANVNWILSDYSRENGATVVWPGSHLRCEPVPEPYRMAHDHPDVHVLEVPFGSVVVWHGNLWHGALPRSAEGTRYNLVLPYCRYYVQAQELYWASVDEAMLERNPSRFATLMGLNSVWPWLGNQPDMELLASGPEADSPYE